MFRVFTVFLRAFGTQGGTGRLGFTVVRQERPSLSSFLPDNPGGGEVGEPVLPVLTSPA